MRMVEHMKNNPVKYATFGQLAGQFDNRIEFSNTIMRNASRLLTQAKTETLHRIDVVLLTYASAGNNFFHNNFSADFVVVEDDHLKPSALIHSRQSWRTFIQRSPCTSAVRSETMIWER